MSLRSALTCPTARVLVVGDLPDLAEPFAQPLDRRKLGVVVVAPPSPAQAVQVFIERGHVAELLTIHPIGVDQPTCGPQCELSVMTKNHLTHDPFRR